MAETGVAGLGVEPEEPDGTWCRDAPASTKLVMEFDGQIWLFHEALLDLTPGIRSNHGALIHPHAVNWRNRSIADVCYPIGRMHAKKLRYAKPLTGRAGAASSSEANKKKSVRRGT